VHVFAVESRVRSWIMLFGSVIYFDFVFVNFVWICAGFLSCELSLVLMGIQFVIVVVFRFFEIYCFPY
jgi:hypothetical protein